MNFEDLKNPELQERLKSCNTAEELAAISMEYGVELGDAELDSLSAGSWCCDEWECPFLHCAYGPCR